MSKDEYPNFFTPPPMPLGKEIVAEIKSVTELEPPVIEEPVITTLEATPPPEIDEEDHDA